MISLCRGFVKKKYLFNIKKMKNIIADIKRKKQKN